MTHFTRIGIATNLEKDPRLDVTSRLHAWLEARGCEVRVSTVGLAAESPPPPAAGGLAAAAGAAAAGQPLSRFGPGEVVATDAELAGWAELVVVLGGDGTLLGTTRRLAVAMLARGGAAGAGAGVSDGPSPILGVNLGHLGFLTEVELPELYPTLADVLAGRFVADRRLVLEAMVVRGTAVRSRHLAVNEVVVSKGPFARLIEILAYVDGLHVATYPSDGLIVATPTGSTAYSLSAGGPVVHPNLEVMLLTPICPHTMYARAIAVSAASEVRLSVTAPFREAMLTVDGQEGKALEAGDEIVVVQAPVKATFVRRLGWNFYDVLRRKFQEASVGGEGR
jgi:NAD+ kinase